MKRLRRLLLPLLALGLSLGSLPLQASLQACGKGDAAACLRLCARSKALLTQNGKLASLGASQCGVRVQPAQSGLATASFELAAPQSQALAAAFPDLAPALGPDLGDLAGRGPPLASPYLSTRHSQANAPPSFC